MANDNKTPHAAGEYDAEVRRVIPFYEEIQRETLDALHVIVPEPACWIDTGAGTGALVERALPRFPGTRFIVADPSEAMLEQARRRLGAAMAAGRVAILPALASDGLPGAEPRLRAQVVTALMCHHYLDAEARRVAVRACYEVLEPGGVLIAFENIEADSARGRELGLRRWRDFQLRQGRPLETVERHLTRFGSELKPIRLGEHLALLRETGFATVEVLWRAHMQAGFLAVK
ncbi:MAG: methyltransferase domain-containing protein [Planctomycetes bacterium]|nr:methyltransferase domain-containing protein [Planctomycetota bacterium]